MDYFMAFRETVYVLLGLPILFYGVRILLKLGNVDVSSSRLFLRGDRFLRFLGDLFFFSLLGLIFAILLYLWWLTNLEVFRISGGLISILALTFLLSAVINLSRIVEV